MENWMSQLDDSLRASCPLIRLAIPGSHDSMMYKMMSHSPLTPEAPGFLEWLLKVYPDSVKHWVVTQSGDATEQLMNGIRYFDIRVCLQDKEFMLCHGVFSGESIQPLKDINKFLDAHPLEMVILDFQHVYRCQPEDHQRYCQQLVEIFGSKIYSRKGNVLSKCTLRELEEKGKQVILIYRDYLDQDGHFWTGNDFRTPWPNTTNLKELVTFLEENVAKRNKLTGHVTQCVLTPDGKFITENLLHDLRTACAKPVLYSMTDWIRTRKTGPSDWPGHNIFIADFVSLNDYQFVRAVLSLNGIRTTKGTDVGYMGSDQKDPSSSSPNTTKRMWTYLNCFN